MSIETRLRALEAALQGSTGTSEANKPVSRIHALEAKLDSLAKNQQGDSTLKQLWDESDKLMRELHPGSALTHQQQIAAPILYRRQEVLASAESLQRNMEQVREILTLLSIGQPQIIGEEPVSEMQVIRAPIVETAPPSTQDQERLRKLELSLHETHQKLESMTKRMDKVVVGYKSLVKAVAQKMVLASEDSKGSH